MSEYAARTIVSVEKSRAEIEGILRRYGASGFLSGWDEHQAFIAFKMQNRQVKFVLPIPNNIDAMQAALETAGIKLLFGHEGESLGISYVGKRT